MAFRDVVVVSPFDLMQLIVPTLSNFDLIDQMLRSCYTPVYCSMKLIDCMLSVKDKVHQIQLLFKTAMLH